MSKTLLYRTHTAYCLAVSEYCRIVAFEYALDQTIHAASIQVRLCGFWRQNVVKRECLVFSDNKVVGLRR
jgi:hypothetical protein